MSNEMVSIKSGSTPALRAVLAVSATTTPPASATDGTPSPRSRYLHIIGSLAGAPAETADYEVYVFDATSEQWTRISDIGTSGTVSLNTTSAPADRSKTEVNHGVDRVAVVCSAISAAPPTLTVWCGVSGDL